MVVEELIESGAKVEIKFHHCNGLKEAYEKIKPFKHLGKIKRSNRNGTYWVEIVTRKVEVTAFYEYRTKK